MVNLQSVLFFSVALVIAAFLMGGRYTIATTHTEGSGNVFVVDRFTGKVKACAASVCKFPTLQ